MARLLCSKNLVLVHVPSLAPALSLSHSPLCSPARCDCSVWLSSMFLSIAALCGFHSWGQGGILSTEVRNEKWNAGFFFFNHILKVFDISLSFSQSPFLPFSSFSCVYLPFFLYPFSPCINIRPVTVYQHLHNKLSPCISSILAIEILCIVSTTYCI